MPASALSAWRVSELTAAMLDIPERGEEGVVARPIEHISHGRGSHPKKKLRSDPVLRLRGSGSARRKLVPRLTGWSPADDGMTSRGLRVGARAEAMHRPRLPERLRRR